MKKKTYSILRLPEGAIRRTSKKCNREDHFYKIVGDLVPEAEQDLKMRPRAAEFVATCRGNSKIYAVLYSNNEEKKMKCLFLFKFVYNPFYGDGSIVEIRLCRCLGKNMVKRHKNFVEKLIQRNSKFIETFQEKRCCKFTFCEETPEE